MESGIIHLKEDQSDIWIGKGAMSLLEERVKNTQSPLYLCTDRAVWPEVGMLWQQKVPSMGSPFHYFKAGEQGKQIEEVHMGWDALLKAGADRNITVVNLGGGVVCDMGGFMAATYKRGVSFIQVPTSLLAMADASVGGKTAINIGEEKNMVGVFAYPQVVYIDPDFLDTLPESEFLSGSAEVLKMQLIMGDLAYAKKWPVLFEYRNFPIQSLVDAIHWKIEIVAEDFRENGRRKILNFGHTFGHALEALYIQRKTPIPHGWAVAWGMVFELYLSVLHKGFPLALFRSIRDILEGSFGCPLYGERDYLSLVSYMLHDKKTQNQEIYPVLLSSVGTAHYDKGFTADQILSYLKDGDTIYTF